MAIDALQQKVEKMKLSSPTRLQNILVFIFFASLFVFLTDPISDPDFWWHLASGKWMFEHQNLMADDPFSVAYNFPVDHTHPRKAFVLHQYWLAQIIMYVFYLLAGLKGVIVLRAFLLTSMFVFQYLVLRREGVGRLIALLFIAVSVKVVVDEIHYIGDKPQIWTSVFSAVVVFLLAGVRNGNKWSYIILPLLMLLWANMHGGFILGDVTIFLYAVGTMVAGQAKRPFYLVGLISILISGVNPGGFDAFFQAISWQSPEALKIISENRSILEHGSLMGMVRGLPVFATLVFFSLVVLLMNFQFIRKRPELVLIYLLAFGMGITSIRFIFFFVFMATLLTSVNLADMGPRFSASLNVWISSRLARVIPALAGIIVILFVFQYLSKGVAISAIKSEQPYRAECRGAVDFIKSHGLKGNMLNDYNVGGYIIWRLWPDIRVFIDGRILYTHVFSIFRITVNFPLTPFAPNDPTPTYTVMLDGNNVDLVVMPGCDKISGTLITLIRELVRDEKWALVYADSETLVFLRNKPEYRQFIAGYALPKSVAGDQILFIADWASKYGHAAMIPDWKLSMAVGYEGKGEYEKASQFLNDYLHARPTDQFAQNLRKEIDAKIGRIN